MTNDVQLVSFESEAISTSQACCILHVSMLRVFQLAESGALSPLKDARDAWFFLRSDVIAYRDHQEALCHPMS